MGQGHGAERLQMMVGRCLNGKMEAGSGAGGGGVGAMSRALQRVTCAAAGLHKPARCHQAQ